MPPKIPRRPLVASVSSSATLTTLTILTTARQSLNLNARLLHASSAALAHYEVPIPPESPRFIKARESPQNHEPPKKFMKGTLPVPREIFTRRSHGDQKIEPGFVDKTSPRSKAELAGRAAASDKGAWRRRMAESRRQALAAGIKGLWERKQTRESTERARRRRHWERNEAAARAPERDDDVWTRPTVRLNTFETKVIRDPDYAEHQRASAARTRAIQEAASQARKDALQRLYIAAGDFIVTEEELAKKVETIFAEDYFNSQGSYHYRPRNIWEAQGRPATLREALTGLTKADNISENTKINRARTLAKKRVREVAGELTGGKVVD